MTMADGVGIPEETALYHIFGDEDLLLYIGISKDFGQRWKNEARDFPWWDEKRRMTTDWYPSRPEAATAERAAIKAEHPKHNKAHNVNKPPRTRKSGSPPEVAVLRERRAEVLDFLGARPDWCRANEDRFPEGYDPGDAEAGPEAAEVYLTAWRALTDPSDEAGAA
jgi:hypothetical protein